MKTDITEIAMRERPVQPEVRMRPPIRYYGGKWRLADWIIEHFPKHENYIEPCGGAASVLLQKSKAPLEIYNDLDENVVNFFRVLRNHPEELIRKIRLTPWARYEHSLECYAIEDQIEWARRFWVSIQMSISASIGYKNGFRTIKTSKHTSSHPDLFDKNLESLNFAYHRFSGVIIENLDAIECIKKYDNNETLIYFDPPYLENTRTHTRYHLETDNDFHTAAANVLNLCKSYVVVSGYKSDLYFGLYEKNGWHRIDKRSQMNGGGKHRIESIWISPKTKKALDENGQLNLSF